MSALLSSACWTHAADLAGCGRSVAERQAHVELAAQMKPSRGGIWHVRVGTGRPLLFIHGWTMDHRDEVFDYEPLMQSRSGWQRIYIDLPGMGASAATTVRDQDHMLRSLLEFIDEEIGDEPFALAGTSLGAYLARAVAASRGDQIIGMHAAHAAHRACGCRARSEWRSSARNGEA